MDERRKAKRMALNIPVSAEIGQNGQSSVRAVDISVNGIQIQSDEVLSVGSTIALQLAGLTLLANIVRRTEDCYGCQFFDVKEDDQYLINKTVWKIDTRNLEEKVISSTSPVAVNGGPVQSRKI